MVRAHDAVEPKVSAAMTIICGLGGPKANPRGVADGQPVNIPALLLVMLRSDGASQRARVIGFTSRRRRRRFQANPRPLNAEAHWEPALVAGNARKEAS